MARSIDHKTLSDHKSLAPPECRRSRTGKQPAETRRRLRISRAYRLSVLFGSKLLRGVQIALGHTLGSRLSLGNDKGCNRLDFRVWIKMIFERV